MATLTYKDPIKVICVKTASSKKLIKGAIYSATHIGTSYNKERYIRITVGHYSLDCFTHIDGSSLENIPDFIVNRQDLDKDKDYTDQCVKCNYSSNKTLKEGEIYYVEAQKNEIRYDWHKNPYNHITLKIRGMKNWTSSSNFEEVPVSDQRKIKLKNIRGEKVKTGESTRKFLLYSKKERTQILLQLLTSCIADINNTELTEQVDISKLILKKGTKYNILEEDVRPFINSLKTILKPYNFLVV